ncbi:MAG TPA: hypothetical protein VKB86_03665 [Pyrinomonadaceae bacterium]|nr:hypothetical protein [Pyrinomonadaceae bacterium]
METLMRRALTLLLFLINLIAWTGCGTQGPRPPIVNAGEGERTANTAGRASTVGTRMTDDTVPTGPTSTNTGQSAGVGPHNQGIGGAVTGNTNPALRNTSSTSPVINGTGANSNRRQPARSNIPKRSPPAFLK